MNFQDLKIIIGQIKKKISCLKCKARYTDQDIEMIGSLENAQTFFYAVCPSCELEAVINVCIHTDHLGRTYADEMISPRLERLGDKIESNEILDMHNFLKEFNGDFVAMFKEKNPNPHS